MQATTVSNVDRYEKMDKLGEGTYGVVYKAKDRQTGEVSQPICNLIHDFRLSLSRKLGSKRKMMVSQVLPFVRFHCSKD